MAVLKAAASHLLFTQSKSGWVRMASLAWAAGESLRPLGHQASDRPQPLRPARRSAKPATRWRVAYDPRDAANLPEACRPMCRR